MQAPIGLPRPASLPVGGEHLLDCAGHRGQGPTRNRRNTAHRQPGDLPNADGHWISGQNVICSGYDRLVDLDASLRPQPALAESWDANSDFAQVTFEDTQRRDLPLGARRCRGRTCRVEFTTASSLTRKIDSSIKATRHLARSETPDKNTVVLKATQPWPAIFNVLAWTNILDPQVPPDQNKPAGTGPFSFVEWVQGDHFTLKKNANYWQAGKPYLDGLEIKIFSDGESIVCAARKAEPSIWLVQPLIRDALRQHKISQIPGGLQTRTGG